MIEKEIHQFLSNLQKITPFHNDYILIHKKIPRLYLIPKRIYDEFLCNHRISPHIKNDYLTLKRWLYLSDLDKTLDYNNPKNVLSLRVSEDCNLACRYCYNKKNMLNKSGIKYMSEITAQKTLDFFLSNFNKKDISVVFFGGEPLLNFKTIKYILNYTKREYKDINFDFKLITNGTILNKKIIDEIIKNDIKVMVSLDLPSSQHNYNRPFKDGSPSFETIKHNLELLLKYIPRQNIILRTIIPYDTKFKVEDIVLSFYNMNLPTENLCINVEFGQRISFTKKHKIEKEKRILIKKYRNCILNFNNKKLYKKEIIGNLLYTIISGRQPIDECPAAKTAFTVNPLGDIYFCDVSANKKEFYLGNIKDGFDLIKLEKIKESFLNNPKNCVICWASSFCGRFCPLIRPNRDILLKNCIKQKKEFIEELFFFLNLDYTKIKNLLSSVIYFTEEKKYVDLQNKYLNLYLEIYKFLNKNNKYIRPVNILPY